MIAIDKQILREIEASAKLSDMPFGGILSVELHCTARCKSPQFAVAATNHGARSSDEMGSVELKWDGRCERTAQV